MTSPAPRKRINLYTAEFRPPQRTLPTTSLLLGVAIFAAGLVTLYAWDFWSLQNHRQAANLAVQQAAAQEAELTRAVATLQGPADPAILAEAETLEARIRAMQAAETALADGTLGSPLGYSPHFQALSRATVPGAWLTHIAVSGGGKAMTLAGQATSSEAPARLIAALGRQPVLAGLHFAALELGPPAPPEGSADHTPPARTDTLNFTLSASLAESPAPTPAPSTVSTALPAPGSNLP